MMGDITDDATLKLNVLYPDLGVLHFSIKSAGLAQAL